MTFNIEILNRILAREGENRWPDANGKPTYLAPGDRGGRTSWGISERAHPDAWRNGPPSRERARAIYESVYLTPWAWVHYDPLREQLIDISINSGERRAATLLQLTLDIDPDGIVGPHTRAAVGRYQYPSVLRHLNHALVAERVRFLVGLANDDPTQRINLRGWINRAVEFIR
jgi:lysozyme family protein